MPPGFLFIMFLFLFNAHASRLLCWEWRWEIKHIHNSGRNLKRPAAWNSTRCSGPGLMPLIKWGEGCLKKMNGVLSASPPTAFENPHPDAETSVRRISNHQSLLKAQIFRIPKRRLRHTESSDWRVSAVFLPSLTECVGYWNYDHFLSSKLGPNWTDNVFEPIHNNANLGFFCVFTAHHFCLSWNAVILVPLGGSIHLFAQSLGEKSGLLWCTIEVKARYRLAILSCLCLSLSFLETQAPTSTTTCNTATSSTFPNEAKLNIPGAGPKTSFGFLFV